MLRTKFSFNSSGNTSSLVDQFEVPVTCPKCGHETKQTIAWLECNPEFVCAGCSQTIKIETDASFREVTDDLRNIDRIFDRIAKP